AVGSRDSGAGCESIAPDACAMRGDVGGTQPGRARPRPPHGPPSPDPCARPCRRLLRRLSVRDRDGRAAVDQLMAPDPTEPVACSLDPAALAPRQDGSVAGA